ncbi:unnamed protein product [Prorocentrum cordatum]|uniref:Uncharacterized protein n=1 Tax=Prorocentrum cordatum TaxID=2364126 RepID=A0ABN9Y3C2_9DINO|nr:unnamed protein product [Polarella glacialis]
MVTRLDVIDPVRVQSTNVLEACVVKNLKDDLFSLVLGPCLNERLAAAASATTVKSHQDDTNFDGPPAPRVQQRLVEHLPASYPPLCKFQKSMVLRPPISSRNFGTA